MLLKCFNNIAYFLTVVKDFCLQKLKCFFPKYSDKDFVNIIKYYICKILLEKFYLHEKKLINLFSKEQKKDDYKKYLSILKEVEKL